MNIYQTVMILNVNMSTTETKAEIKKYNNMLQDWCKTKKVKVEDMGVKKLAYTVKGIHTEGHYVSFTYMSHYAHIPELEKQLRTDDQVIKFITMNLDEGIKGGEIKLENRVTPMRSQKEKQKNKNIDAMDVLLGLTDYV